MSLPPPHCDLLPGRAKFVGAFAALTLGHRHVHLLGGEPEGCQLRRVAAPGARVVVENARWGCRLVKPEIPAFVGVVLS